MKSSHISKKKFFCTLVPIILLKLMENLKSQCKTKEGKYCSLAENLFHHPIRGFPVLIIEAISTLNVQQ